MTRAGCGTICTASTMIRNPRRPRNRNRVSAVAARKAMPMATTTTEQVTRALLSRSVPKCGRWTAEAKLARVNGNGRKCGVELRMSPVGLNAVLSIQ